MKKVLTHGYDKFQNNCKRCGCHFVYELSDVEYHYIECPECSYPNRHEMTNLIPPNLYNEFMSDDWVVKDYPVR